MVRENNYSLWASFLQMNAMVTCKEGSHFPTWEGLETLRRGILCLFTKITMVVIPQMAMESYFPYHRPHIG